MGYIHTVGEQNKKIIRDERYFTSDNEDGMTTVLMVDDNPADLDQMNIILTGAGYSTLTQPDGIHILDYIEEHHPDIIMLDLVMITFNGIEILREVKRDYPNIPVIMCSGAGLEQVVALAMRVGASGYVVKPYRDEDLLDSIKKVRTDT